MMSARRSAAKAKPRRRSLRSQRLRHGSQRCCNERIYARIEELLDANQKFPPSRRCEAVYSRFLLKFTQCRPWIQSAKSRLQESFELLSQVDELLEFFCDPRRLWAYLSEEQPQTRIETTDQSLPTDTQTSTSVDVALQSRDNSKTLSCGSHYSKKPEVETIAEERDESSSSPTRPEETELTEGHSGERSLRDSELLSRVASHHVSSQKQTPETASFAMPRYDRAEMLNTAAWNRYSKRFKTSTPAEHSPAVGLSPPRISLIPHKQRECGRQRRKAIMIEPPEENGAWMGTPVIRNPLGSVQSDANNGERLKRLSLNWTENAEPAPLPNNPNPGASEHSPIMPLRGESGNVTITDTGKSLRETLGQGQEHRVLEGKSERPMKDSTNRPRRTARTNVVPRTQKRSTKISTLMPQPEHDVDGRKTPEPLPSTGAVVENTLPTKRSLRKATGTACLNEPSCKKKRK